jgi:hypothetical protein
MNRLQNQIEKSGRRFVILYDWKKNLGVKCIALDMNQRYGPDAGSKAKIGRLVERFKQDDFSCKDESRAARR